MLGDNSSSYFEISYRFSFFQLSHNFLSFGPFLRDYNTLPSLLVKDVRQSVVGLKISPKYIKSNLISLTLPTLP